MELTARRGRISIHFLQGGPESLRSLPRLCPLRAQWGEALPSLTQPLPCPVSPALQLDPTFESVDGFPQRIQTRIKSAAAVPPSVPASSARTITPVCIHLARPFSL